MEQQLLLMEQAVETPDVFLEADLNFHIAIAEAAHNRLLLNAVQLIRNLMRQWIAQTLQVPGTAAEALRQHKQIYASIVAKDTEGARRAMAAHLDIMGKLLLVSRRGGVPHAVTS